MTENRSTTHSGAVAIIGMGCIFPKSRNLKEYWHLLFNGIDAIGPIPESHWKLSDYFDPDPGRPDHTYCKRGGFLPQITFDPLSYGIPPNNLEATDTSQLLGLEVAKMALQDAGYPPGHPFLEQHKVNVVMGVTGTQELVIPLGARLGHPIWRKALADSGVPEEKQQEVLERISGGYVQWQENSFPGLLGNVIAGRIANRFNLSGTNSACDAACASSLAALHTAIMELNAHKCDMSITGGADTLNDIFMHMCFSKTGVLSHTSDARPFSKDADGTVLGEGVGMLVLKRLEDAQKDGDRVYAVIKGLGTSSDGRTSAIYAPESKGQVKALKEAYGQAGVAPSTVGLIEAHGTGTRVGDKVEFDALKTCFGDDSERNRTAIGSVKSMIGHTKAAAGVAGMIKSVLALHHKVIPPTLKAAKPDPELDINNSSFYLNDSSRPWIECAGEHPRRSGVSAFGFGGSNFHTVLEEYTGEKQHVSWDGSVQILAFSAGQKKSIRTQIDNLLKEIEKNTDPNALERRIAQLASESRAGFNARRPVRLLIVHNRHEDIRATAKEALDCLENETCTEKVYCSANRAKGKLGFLFPGQGSQYTGMGRDLISVFPEALDAMEKGCRAFDGAGNEKSLHEYIFAPPSHVQPKKKSEEQLRKTNVAQPAIGAVSLGLIRILSRFGVRPDTVCGHSFGELAALCAADWIDENAFLSLSVDRGKHMAAAGEKNKDAGSMLAVQAPLDVIETLLKDNDLDLVLANQNSPAQGVLSGRTDEILRAKEICKSQKIRVVQLPVAAAFHSSLVKDAAVPFANAIDKETIRPGRIHVLSNTTGTYYENDEALAKELLANQLANPVRFVDNIRKMADDGVDTFIEVGPKTVLAGLVKIILKGSDVTVTACDETSKNRNGITCLAHVLARVAVNGFDVDLTSWEDKPAGCDSKKMQVMLNGANPKPSKPSKLPVSEPMQVRKTLETPAAKTQEKNKNKEEPIKREPGMTTHRNTNPVNVNTPSIQAMDMVRQGLEAMQKLQEQTARAHEKFLDTQAQASRTLAGMMEQTRYVSGGIVPYPDAYEQVAEKPSAGRQDTRMYVPEPVQTHSQPQPAPTPAAVPENHIETVTEKISMPEPEAAARQEKKPGTDTRKDDTLEILFQVVSKLTGFPVEMLEPEMDIESDLGIDSIKKVEIISELEKKIPSCEGLGPENIGSVRTLNEICLAISGQEGESDSNPAPALTEKAVDEPKTPAASANNRKNKVGEVLVEIISELTGFPVEMLEPSMNLESDLGIDSIKRVEILSKLEQQLDHIDSISSDDIAVLKTIGEITQFLSQTGEDKEPGVKKKLQNQPSESEKPGELKELSRQVVRLKEYPTNQIRFYNGAKIELAADKTVYITRDSSGLSEKLAQEFSNAGVQSKIIDIMSEPVRSYADTAGIVLVPDAFVPHSEDEVLRFLSNAFDLIHRNGAVLMENAASKGAFFAAVTFMGGTFGFGNRRFSTDPLFAGLPGLVKTAGIEFKNVLCRALDMPDDPKECLKNAEAAAALMMTHGSIEMGIDGDTCFIPELEDKQIDPDRKTAVTGEDVFVVTGGAKGVTAACALELARHCAPKMALIGRSEIIEESDWARGLETEAELKKAILEHAFKGKKPIPADIEKKYRQIVSSREIKTNIETMKAAGAKVAYYSADVKDHEQMRLICDRVKGEFGPITGIVHGAGILEDKLIIDKQPEQFARVVQTKVSGLSVLLAAVDRQDLRHLVLFSSVAARTGNQGQCDYALANEILNKTAAVWALDQPHTNVLSINWGPWEGGMVDPSLKKEFLKRGIDLIPLEAGALQMVDELAHQESQGPEIVIGAHLMNPGNKKKKNDKVSKVFSAEFGEKTMPVLASHVIGGEPVVPFAFLMEYQAAASENANPGLVLAGIDNMRLLKGLRVGTPVKADINMGKCSPGKSGLEAFSTITSNQADGSKLTHASGVMRLKEKRQKPPVLSKAAFMDLAPYPKSVAQAYSQVLFHGADLQGIKAVNGYSEKGIEVVTKLSPVPEKWIKEFPKSKWTLEPMMLDAAFQAAILWTYETKKQVCLPAFIANFRLYSSFDHLNGDIRILFTVNEETKHKIKGYFTFLDENRTVVASITGFEAIVDPHLHEKFKNKPLFEKESILAFAQGKPSEAFGDKYKVFDKDRQIARLPRPPYFFMDRVLKADHPQWVMQPGGVIETQYDIPVDEWYFKANQTRTMPFCVLLEIALQPCGWLAAYAGSALHSEERLHFRNLGGKAVFHRPVEKDSGTLTVKCSMKEVSKAGGMIIQDFDLAVLNRGETVYEGTTNFGFFSAGALANQLGVRNSRYMGYELPDVLAKAPGGFELPCTAPITPEDKTVDEKNGMPSKALLMVDRIDQLCFEGGLYDQGYVKGIKTIDPKEWFFDAHFYQDPVCPGSLGIESFLQLLRIFLIKKYDIDPDRYLPDLVAGQTHEWVYRGQIVQKNRQVEVDAHISKVEQDDDGFTCMADGALIVDGICIYEMTGFTFAFTKISGGRSKALKSGESRKRKL